MPSNTGRITLRLAMSLDGYIADADGGDDWIQDVPSEELDTEHQVPFDEYLRDVDVVVPGHGAVAEGAEVADRLAVDRAYMEALRRGADPADARLEQDWLAGPHQSNLEQARATSG